MRKFKFTVEITDHAVDVATALIRAGISAPSFEEMERLMLNAIREQYPLLTDEEIRRNDDEGRHIVQKTREAFMNRAQD